MDNNEEKNVATNDFEIIDIPNTSEEGNNQFEQITNNIAMEQNNVNNIQNGNMEVEQVNIDDAQSNNINVEQVPTFNVQQNNLEQPDYQQSYNELNAVPQEATYNNVQYQQSEPIDTRETSNVEMSNSYNEIGNETMNSSNLETEKINGIETTNYYNPVSSSNNNQEETKGKLDKSVKEIITMGIIVALVIILLPVLYNVSTGKYNITSNIKNTVSSLFNKSSNKSTENKSKKENQSTIVEDSDEEQTAEDLGLTFDFSKYNNQVLDNVNLNALLEGYKDYLILLAPSVENGIQTYKIQVAKDVKSAGYSISDPEQALKEFSAQYLQTSANYLIAVTSDNDNITTIVATKQ